MNDIEKVSYKLNMREMRSVWPTLFIDDAIVAQALRHAIPLSWKKSYDTMMSNDCLRCWKIISVVILLIPRHKTRRKKLFYTLYENELQSITLIMKEIYKGKNNYFYYLDNKISIVNNTFYIVFFHLMMCNFIFGLVIKSMFNIIWYQCFSSIGYYT